MASLTLPEGQTAVKVTIIDTGARIKGPLSLFVEPPLLDHLVDEGLAAPAYVFLVEHETSGRKIVFDLGIRKNAAEYAPVPKSYHKDFELTSGEEVFDFLQDRGVDLKTVEAIVWSHHHLDHVGNPAGFPSTTDLIVGPGFKETILPGYPKNPKAQILESDYEGRNLRQLNFDVESDLTIGGFRAVDYFKDGSFYLLESPGHTIDHVAGLARTSTTPSRFILMGADIGHHASQWRPSEFLKLPTELSPSPLGLSSRLNIRLNVCPGELFTEHVHPEHSDSAPFLRIAPGHPYDVDLARKALKSMELFDADERILVITAHDYTLLPVLKFWPETANGWHEARWKEDGLWRFLRDFAKHVNDKALD